MPLFLKKHWDDFFCPLQHPLSTQHPNSGGAWLVISVKVCFGFYEIMIIVPWCCTIKTKGSMLLVAFIRTSGSHSEVVLSWH